MKFTFDISFRREYEALLCLFENDKSAIERNIKLHRLPSSLINSQNLSEDLKSVLMRTYQKDYQRLENAANFYKEFGC